ncbi:MAG: NrdJb [Congregibacter sp.]|nr:NrdJb [Congregibacter sp.]MDP5069899.1 NrdJb [Congregibacter sp.]
MSVKIEKKIVGWKVAGKKPETTPAPGSVLADVIEMHEKIKRPETLQGSTYKVKSPNADNALYIVINDIVLNEGTEHERRQPFEIFINSRDMSNYQWVSALTLVISAVFRKGGDVAFLVDELKAVFDPKGGYFKSGKFVPSLVAEIGTVIEQHMISIGLIKAPALDANQTAFLEEKKAALAESSAAMADPLSSDNGGFPASASLCSKCHSKAVVFSDGCMVCLNCSDSKCG